MNTLKKTWFRDTSEPIRLIDENAVRIRAGLMMFIPLFFILTLFYVFYTSPWNVDPSTVEDTHELDTKSHIIYSAEMTKRTLDFTPQTIVLIYALFELLAGMTAWSSRFSPTIQLAAFLSRNKTPAWTPLVPKRFAWGLGLFLVSFCLVFFNPAVFAQWINTLFAHEILPTTVNYIPYQVPVVLVWVCLAMVWLEAVMGFCLGCKIHSLLVRLHLIEEPCYACHNLDWDAISNNRQAQTD